METPVWGPGSPGGGGPPKEKEAEAPFPYLMVEISYAPGEPKTPRQSVQPKLYRSDDL